MIKVIERNIAEIIVTILFILLMSSCGSSGYCIQNEWGNPLSQQYNQNRR